MSAETVAIDRLTRSPTVCAIIPAFNAERFIAAAVASVRAQTHPVSEIVVIDDGSSDSTAEVIASLPGKIRLLRQPNRGPSVARNLGVEHTSADLVAFLDADDEWLPTALEKQVAVFQRMPDVALTTADMSAIDAEGHITKESWFAAQNFAVEVKRWNERPMPNAVAALVRKNFVSTSVVLVRRVAFLQAGGFRSDLRYGEDLELWARIAREHPIVCLPEVLGLRRSHDNNATKSLEPMLRGLLKTSEVIADWGAATLRAQGLSPDSIVARARTDLGYWLFAEERYREARDVLSQALRGSPSWRALRYWLLTWLPAPLADWMRSLRA